MGQGMLLSAQGLVTRTLLLSLINLPNSPLQMSCPAEPAGTGIVEEPCLDTRNRRTADRADVVLKLVSVDHVTHQPGKLDWGLVVKSDSRTTH
jgi:hypothetical protein